MEKEIMFNNIIADIIRNKKFMALKYENHHGISRMDHSLNVAKMAYTIAKKLKFKNLEDVTRAALLHDLFTDDDMGDLINFVAHPMIASKNASENFEINERVKNAIEAHMFPMCKVMPKYKESWIVTASDKLVALYECTRYKAPLKAGVYTFFILNVLTLPIYHR